MVPAHWAKAIPNAEMACEELKWRSFATARVAPNIPAVPGLKNFNGEATHKPNRVATSTPIVTARIISLPEIFSSKEACEKAAPNTVAMGCTTAVSWTQSYS